MARRLVALALEGGPDFVDALRRAWDDGDAVLPIDLRLPPPARDALLRRLRPASIVEETGTTTLADARPVEDGDALVVATSGTTGEPKGVVLTRDAVRASAVATSARLGVDPDRDRWLACLPLAHVGGLSVVTRALLTDTPFDVHPGFEPAAVLTAQRDGATLVSLVTTALARVEVSGFRRVLLGGSAIPADRPANTVATYGLTETGSGCVYDRAPLDGVDLRIVDGEVQVRGPMLLRCYRSGESDHDPKDADGWFPTGDGGAVGDDGVLSVFGRRGDLIVTGGENVWPGPVERILAADDRIDQVVVVGRPDPEWGHVVTAVIVAAGDDKPALDELRDAVRSELPAFAAPRAVEFRRSLPTTALGKIVRSEI